MQIVRGHHFSFTVSDLERSRRFYEDVLGLRPIPRPDFGFPGVWYQVGETQIHLIARPENATPRDPKPPLTPLANHSALEIASYDAARRALQRAEIAFFELGGEARQIFLHDPDGNTLELIEPGGQLGRTRPERADGG